MPKRKPLTKKKTPKAAIRKNRWDNWYGYLSGKRVEAFGLDRQAAEAWLARQVAGLPEPVTEEPKLKLRNGVAGQ